MADGMVEIARATVTIVPNTRGAEKSITDALVPAAGDAGSKAGEKSGTGLLDGLKSMFNGGLSSLKSVMTGGGAELGGVLSSSLGAATSALMPVAVAAAIGKMLFDIGQQFEEVENTIIIGTGASGEALETMVNDVKNVTNSIPAGLGAASQTIADLNTRMGLSGPIAEDLARNILEVEKMTGDAINVNDLTGMFNQFGISGDMAVDKMNVMWAVSQNTGLSFNSLASVLKNNSAQLQMLGFSFEESAAMAGALDKAGIDASGVMSKMSKALTTLAKDGEEPQEAFRRVTDEIGGFIKEGNDAAALDLASELFGTKGAAQFVNAVKSGALEVDNLTSVTELAGGTIDETAQQTMTMGDKIAIMGNKFTNALQPFGTLVLGVVTPCVDFLSHAVDVLTSAFSALTDGIMAGIQPAMQAVEPVITSITEAFGGTTSEGGILDGMLNTIITTIGNVGSVIGSIVAVVISALMPVIQGIFTALSPFVSFIMNIMSVAFTVVQQIVGFISALFQTIVNFVTGSENATAPLEGFFSNLWSMISSFAQTIWNGLMAFIAGLPGQIVNFFLNLPNLIGNLFQMAAGLITSLLTGAKDAVAGIPGMIVGFFASLPGQIGAFLSNAGSFIISALNSAKDAVAGVPGQIANFFSSLPGQIWNFISSIPGKFVEMFSQIHIPTLHIVGEFDLNPAHFRIPSIEFYATGGIVTRPTMAMIGEAGYDEYIVPRSNSYLAELARDLAAVGFSGSREIDYNRVGDSLARALDGARVEVDGRDFGRLVTRYA